MDVLYYMVIFTIFLFFFFCFSDGTDMITSSQPISDGKTLVSQDGSFELGFFSPGSSKGRYLGIWYKNIPIKTVVWVANRNRPIIGLSGLLMVNNTGDLVLTSENKTVVWSSGSKKVAQNPVAQLLHSGNLVLRDEKEYNSDMVLWQSFDYPTDTLLPGMKLGWDLRTGLDRRLSAWKNQDDPSPGDLHSGLTVNNFPELILWKGSKKYTRSGPWNGLRYSGEPESSSSTLFELNFISNEEEAYFTYNIRNKSVISRFVLNQTNSLGQRLIWNEETRNWIPYFYLPRDMCDNYGHCGAYGTCDDTQLPLCQCLKGFKPNSPQNWNSMDWSLGCMRNKPLDCASGDGFIKFNRLKLPDTTYSWVKK